MNKKTFLRHIKNQKKHWWFQARKKIIDQIISNNVLKKKNNILDFGSGSGVNLDILKKYGKVDVHEKNDFARSILKRNKNVQKTFNSLKLRKNYYDIILLADVIEHIENPKILIKNLKKFLKKDGQLLVTVPAYQFLFNKKDSVLGHYRRYNVNTLKKEFKNYKIKNISYFNTFLCLPIIMISFLNKILNRDYINEVETTPNYIFNKILFIIFYSEKFFLRYFNFPFGISIYIVANNA